MLLSFACALARTIIKNLLEHHKSFTMAILYEGPATINLVNMIRNHSELLQEYWHDSSSDSFYQIVMRFYGRALKFTGINK